MGKQRYLYLRLPNMLSVSAAALGNKQRERQSAPQDWDHAVQKGLNAFLPSVVSHS